MAKEGKYVDGFVLVVKDSKLGAYKKMANDAGKVWKKHGALEYFEFVGDDMYHPGMKILTFPKMAKTKKGEKVIFSFIVYKNKAHRDAVNKEVMKEFESDKKHENMPMPFDMKRMAYGGFKTLVEK